MDISQDIYEIVEESLSEEHTKEFRRIHFGREDHCRLTLKESTLQASKKNNFVITGFAFGANTQNNRLVKIGLLQHSIVLATDKPVSQQREAIFDKVGKIIDTAASEGVQIICLQETWPMPFFLCTREKEPWMEFAESATDGPSTKFLSCLAKKYRMVIISPILEDDEGTWWNTAVVIDENGNYLGKHRKNHLPSVGSFNETTYYSPGNTGHPVFKTNYGTFAVNICYGRHHALNWLMFGRNGAEIVFNPAATISKFGESFWGIEARNAAIANNFYTCSINRVGSEEFVKQDGSTVTRNYYGSSYVTAPNGCRTPGLLKDTDGLLIAEVDLNMCRTVKDHWGFNMTSRLDLYAKELNELYC